MFGEISDNKESFDKYDCTGMLENYALPLKERIINHLSEKSEVILKSQQKHEPDFTLSERKAIATELLEKNPSQFLCRFGQHLNREHLQYFSTLPNDAEITFYLQETQKILNDSTKRLKIRNRRYGALLKMESSGSSYFTEGEMRKRDPLLYDELICRNLTEEEMDARIQANAPPPTHTFSDLLFEQIERNVVRDRQITQENNDEDCYEEEEDDDEDEKEYEEPIPIDEGEKKLLEEEFRSSICSQFVAGKDGDFDYSEIDDLDNNDMLEWESRDEEERYFEEESPRTLSPPAEEDIVMMGGDLPPAKP